MRVAYLCKVFDKKHIAKVHADNLLKKRENRNILTLFCVK